jgi:peptidoglycan/LPS O-acetylase OafA/YrhL
MLIVFAALRWFSVPLVGKSWDIDAVGLTPDEREALRIAHEEVALGAAFALLLIYTRPFSERIASFRAYRPLAWLGAITFSLYLIHQFNLTVGRAVASKVMGLVGWRPVDGMGRLQNGVYVALQVAFHLGLSTVFWFFCERPFLNRRLAARSESGGGSAGGTGGGTGSTAAMAGERVSEGRS